MTPDVHVIPDHDAAGRRIERVEVDKVVVPYKQEIQWSAGHRPGTTRLVVRGHTADGTVGVGESIYLLEFIEPVLTETLVPLVIGEDAFESSGSAGRPRGPGTATTSGRR